MQQCIWAKAFYGCSNCWESRTYSRASHRNCQEPETEQSRGKSCTCPWPVTPVSTSFGLPLSTFRRVIRKQPHLVDMWSFLMNRFTGDRSIGPFWKLLEVAEQVGAGALKYQASTTMMDAWISLLGHHRGDPSRSC